MSRGEGLILGVDIGGTWLRAGLVDRIGGVRGLDVIPTSGVFGGSEPAMGAWRESATEATRSLGGHLAAFLRSHRDAAGDVRAVVVGVPGTVTGDGRRVISTTNIPSLQDVAMADLLEDRLGIAAHIDKDVNLLLRHDIEASGLREASVVVGIYVGTGYGNSIAIDGKILRGRHGVAGELGHIPMRGLGERCGCGNVGCVEAVASGRVLSELVAKRFPDTPVEEVFARHAGDARLAQFVDDLSLPIATEVCIFDPDVLVLGGGVLSAPSFPWDELLEAVRRRSRFPVPAENLRVIRASGGHLAGVAGAGVAGFDWQRELSSVARASSGRRLIR